MHAAEVVVHDTQRHRRLSSFFKKPSYRRVNRFMNVRSDRLNRSVCEVHIVRRLSIPHTPVRFDESTFGGAYRPVCSESP